LKFRRGVWPFPDSSTPPGAQNDYPYLITTRGLRGVFFGSNDAEASVLVAVIVLVVAALWSFSDAGPCERKACRERNGV